MKITRRSILTFFTVLLTVDAFAQKPLSPLDRYVETGKTIVVAKCISAGPANIIGQAHDRISILFVVKGEETARDIWITSRYEITEGKTYLLRTENEFASDSVYFKIDSIDSAIPISETEDLVRLRSLSPRIIVLRTMNIRVDTLDEEIRSRTYEIEALKNARREN